MITNKQLLKKRKVLLSHLVKKHNLKAKDISAGFRVIKHLDKKPQKGWELAKKLGLEGEQVRQLILLIRKDMVTGFQNPTGTYYIVATRHGYKLTNKPKELEKYKHSLNVRFESLKRQIEQLELAIINKEISNQKEGK